MLLRARSRYLSKGLIMSSAGLLDRTRRSRRCWDQTRRQRRRAEELVSCLVLKLKVL